MGRRLAVFIKAHIIKGKLPEAIESDAFHETRGNDAVGVNVGTGNIDGTTGNLGDGSKGHEKGERLKFRN